MGDIIRLPRTSKKSLDDLLDAYAVLVLHPDGSIAGIVTNYDTGPEKIADDELSKEVRRLLASTNIEHKNLIAEDDAA